MRAIRDGVMSEAPEGSTAAEAAGEAAPFLTAAEEDRSSGREVGELDPSSTNTGYEQRFPQ
jgi:hypothetical protein